MSKQPLADRLRPKSFQDFVGQQHLVGPKGLVTQLLTQEHLPSLILWGPPGCGKTTLAHLIAKNLNVKFHALSAITCGIREIRTLGQQQRNQSFLLQQPKLVFLDEIHRFNKAQQDALLPYVESGAFTLIGATTENPGFEINAPLLSRCRVLQLHAINDKDLEQLLDRALNAPQGLNLPQLNLSQEARQIIIQIADQDARSLLNLLEVIASRAKATQNFDVSAEFVQDTNHYKSVRYDKAGDQHYQVVSAFIKSLRGSDPDAALYYMTRMLEGGEDPNFILRRLIIFASEDIGNADPTALSLAMSAQQAYHFVGMPEGVLAMSQAVTYLACAPKSNASYAAYKSSFKLVRKTGTLPVPHHLINAPTAFAKKLGHGRGYKYPHNHDNHYVVERYLPDAIQDVTLYHPSEQGFEKVIASRLEKHRKLKQNPPPSDPQDP